MSRQSRGFGPVRAVVEVDHDVAAIVDAAARLRTDRDEEAVPHAGVDVEVDAVIEGVALLAVRADVLSRVRKFCVAAAVFGRKTVIG